MTGRDDLFLTRIVTAIADIEIFTDLPGLLENVRRLLDQRGNAPASD